MVAAMDARWARADVEALLREVEEDIEGLGLGPPKRRARPDGRHLVLDRHGWVHAIVGPWSESDRRISARTPTGERWVARVRAA